DLCNAIRVGPQVGPIDLPLRKALLVLFQLPLDLDSGVEGLTVIANALCLPAQPVGDCLSCLAVQFLSRLVLNTIGAVRRWENGFVDDVDLPGKPLRSGLSRRPQRPLRQCTVADGKAEQLVN